MTRVFVLFLSFMLLATMGYAQDARIAGGLNGEQAPAIERKYKKTAKSNKSGDALSSFARIEELGLRESTYDGGLGRDLWNNTRRSFVMELFDALPVETGEVVLQDMVKGILLTSAPTKAMENDVDDLQAGQDLLTVRLRKLNEMGAYQDAFDLYTQVTDAPYHPRLIEQGIMAMALSGQKSLACVEARSATEIFADDAFLLALIALCDAGWSKNVIEATIENVSTLRGFQSALLVATHQDSPLPLTVSQALKLPVKDVWPALIHDDVSSEVRAALNIRAYGAGLISFKDLKKAYEPLDTDENGKALDIVAAYQAFNEQPSWDRFKTATALEKTYGISALAPFTNGLKSVEIPNSVTNPDLRMIYRAFTVANKKIPEKLFTPLLNENHDRSAVDLYAKLLVTAALSFSNMQKSNNYINELEKVFLTLSPQTQFMVDQHLDMAQDMGLLKTLKSLTYENNLSLTFNEGYVIHSSNTNKRLLEAIHNVRRGEVALISIIVLNARTIGLLYPEHLNNALIGLSEVGLKNVAGRLVITGILSN